MARLKHSGAWTRGGIKSRAEGGRRRQNSASAHIGVGLLAIVDIIIVGVVIKVAAIAAIIIIVVVVAVVVVPVAAIIIARQKFAIIAPGKTHRRLGLLAFGLRRRG